MKPDDVSQTAWDAACGALAVMPATGIQLQSHRRHAVARAIDAATKAERESAATVAETEGVYPELNIWDGGPDWFKHGKRIAAAIRSRSETTP